MIDTAMQLVRERIPGNRKGSDKPAYGHSLEVGEMLREAGFGEEVCVAGVLHDVVEDGDMSLEELRSLGFSHRVVELVGLCSHDNAIEGGDARWVCMMANLVKAGDADAWSIKLADILSNIGDSGTMPEDRRDFLRNVKGKMLLSLTKDSLAHTPLWSRLAEAVSPALVAE